MRTFTALVSAAALLVASTSAIPTIRQEQEDPDIAIPTPVLDAFPSPSLGAVDATLVPVPIPIPSQGAPEASPVPSPAQQDETGLGTVPEGLEPSESEEPSESPEDDPICFPAHATVEKEDGSVVRMENVQVGDRVKVAEGQFSEVFMFTHRLADVDSKFVKISAADKTLELTAGHYLYVNGRMTAAKAVQVGDVLEIEGASSAVEKVEVVSGKGLYNPQTLSGDIVVNGVKASTYTTAVEPSVAHWLLAPMRSLYKTVGFSTAVLDKGNYGLAALAPRGQAVY